MVEINEKERRRQISLNFLIKLYNERKFDELISKATIHLNEFSKDLNAWNALALGYKNIGEFEKAKNIYIKILKIKPNLDYVYSNLANVLYDMGKVKECIEIHKKALSHNPNNVNSINGIGLALSDQGKDNEAISYYKKILSSDPENPDVNFNMASSLRRLENYNDAALCYKKSIKPLSKSFQLECIYYNKDCNINEFYSVLDEIIEEPKLNPLAACLSSHASIRFDKKDKYPFCNQPFDFIQKFNLFDNGDLSDDFINEFLNDLNKAKIATRSQSLLKNGVQTSGNLFNLEFESVKKLEIILQKQITKYRKIYENKKDGYIKSWPKKYKLWGWIIVINNEGKLLPHMHKEGWLSSSIYLKRPKKNSDHDGDIKFSLHGANYPSDGKNFNYKTVNLRQGDMVMFPSSLFHSTIPFNSTENRVTLAFDLMEIP